jgi:PUB domain/UBX domain
MTSPSTSSNNLSVSALDEAASMILNNNFDADSKACLITLMKVLDNVIQKPYDAKVRSIRLANPAFANKVASRKGGVEFLLACGFSIVQESPPLLSKEPQKEEVFLVLKDDDDDDDDDDDSDDVTRKEAYKAHIITARRLLLTRATRDLNMKAEELPAYKPPPPPVVMSDTTTSNINATFNPFQTQRYDGMSAAAGTQLTPDSTYQSSTEAQLQNLQAKHEKLERSLQKELLDRQWVASLPTTGALPTIQATTAEEETGTKGNAGLLAAQFQKQQVAKKQREEGGFTTKSMRELEKLKKQKVYSHTLLALQFANGTVVQGKFLPKETIQTVMTALQQDCFLSTTTTTTTNNSNNVMELYVTPPRKTLSPKATLQEEGLVPAARIFVKCDNLPSSFLKPHLFAAYNNNNAAAFPSSVPVVAKSNETNDTKNDDTTAPAAITQTTAADKEEELMRRMMGGGRQLGGAGGGSAGAAAGKRNNADAKKPKPGSGKPKWFK